MITSRELLLERIRSFPAYKSRRQLYIYTILTFTVCIFIISQLYPSNKSRSSLHPLNNSRPSLVGKNGAKKVWNYQRDGKRLVLEKQECEATFPGLYQEVDQQVEKYRYNKITAETLDAVEPRNGYIRAMLYDQEVRFCSLSCEKLRPFSGHSYTT